MKLRLRRDKVYPLGLDTYGEWDLWVTGPLWMYETTPRIWKLVKEYVNEAQEKPPARKARAVGKVRA